MENFFFLGKDLIFSAGYSFAASKIRFLQLGIDFFSHERLSRSGGALPGIVNMD
jgi:hypothetical protein